jgi:hypothetical protein
MKNCVYKVTVKDLEGFFVTTYCEGKENQEAIILDFMWQKYYNFQDNKSFYEVVNISENNSFRESLENILHYHLASKTIDYVNKYS